MSDEQDFQETKERVWAELENVIDPELGVDIVNLGLVYEVDLDPDKNVAITMTLTSMGCPLAGMIQSEIKNALSGLQDVNEIGEVEANIVWNPPWDKDKMSRYAKIALGVAD
ncbi:metal-sulfur cluster assembly factor [Salicibibacter halophilus]|uniref:Metal-sulfur cluster assembly factor n=1 Tax=Salicibibacter halophilus TaxID=2502791 RepID=A0A514LFS3_9BACI|nr:metal-sulfur cluster assembly factor [Salicibibacter halophilus]QDI90091.1 metal-sulfur cluster assembly factor [Salicibibacter halophilus]